MRIISKKRFAGTTIGVILAVAIIFSTFTLGNNESKVEMYNTLSKAEYHIKVYFEANGSNMGDVLGKIENLPHVERLVGTLEMLLYDGNISLHLLFMINMPVPALYKGRYPEKVNEIAISREYSEALGVDVGDTIALGSPYNITFNVTGILASPVTLTYRTYHSESSSTSSSFTLTTLETMEEFQEVNAELGVKMDPRYLISSRDMNELRDKVFHTEAEVLKILREVNAQSITIDDFVEELALPSFVMLFPLIFSLPVIVMGAYLSKVGIEIELFERRREFGILRIRGATNKQRFKFLLMEGLFYAIFGGIVGYLLGESVAYITNLLLFHLPFFFMDFGVVPIVGAVLISILLFFLALYKPWKKIASTPLIELISHYSQEFKNPEYRIGRDIVAVTVLWVYLIAGIYLTLNFDVSQGLTLITILVAIILFTLTFMFPLILIYLPLATARLLTMGFPGVYEFIASGISRFMRTSGDIVKKSVRRNPKNVAHLAFILAFLLTLSTFISVSVDTQGKYAEITGALDVGGDFNVPEIMNLTLLKNSVNVSSFAVYSQSHGIYYSEEIEIISVDYEKYRETVYPLNYFIKEGYLKKGEIAITEKFARKYHLKVGDTIEIGVRRYTPSGMETKYEEYRIGCIMLAIPGTGGFGEALLDKQVDEGNMSGVFIKAKNYEALKKELDSWGVCYDERMEQSSMRMEDFTSLLLLYLVLLGASSIFIIQYSLYLNRRGEIALYRVRGARRRQSTAILMAEGTTVIAISLLIGLLVGGVLAYFVAVLMSAPSSMPVIFVMGRYFATVTVLLVGIFLISQYLLSLKFAMVDVNEVIREIGGEM